MRSSLALLLTIFSSPATVAEDERRVDGPVIGIDLGTTYSCVGVYKNGRVEIIPNNQGNRITPSYVAFTDEDRFIGEAAKNQATINPEQTIFDVKRLIGRRFREPSVQKDMKMLPFKIVDKGGKPHITVKVQGKDKTMGPEEVSAMILTKMKETAEAYLGKDVKHAVITVPAYFGDAQRQSTKDAGAIAGLEVMRIINEPTAAAIAYGLDKRDEMNVLVYDFGGGTFDVSLLNVDNGVFQVLATSGDTHLGGEDLDQRVMEHFMKIFNKKTGKDMSTDKRAMQKLRREVERAKRGLSTTHQARIEIEALFAGADFDEVLTRAKFEELCADLLKKTLDPVKQVMKDSGIDIKKIDEILLVGGSTRIPKVQALLKDFFKKEPNKHINPDEAVAYGAAVQAGILSGESLGGGQELLLLDVTPLSLGTEVVGGIMEVIIPRNTAIPTKKTSGFVTEADNQESVDVMIFEGERPMIKDNHRLGKFVLSGIPPKPAGQAEMDVTFEIDSNGILIVEARSLDSGSKKKITIKNDKGRLSEAQIQKMVSDSEKFAEEDARTRARIDAKNALTDYLNSASSSIKGEAATEKIDEEDLKEAQNVIKAARKWITENEETAAPDEIREKQAEVEETVAPIMSALHGKQGGQSSSSSGDDEGYDSEL